MAEASGLNQTAVGRIWRAFGLRPHRSEHFRLSPDPQFVDKVRDVVGLYLNPPEAAVVLCVEEKSGIQALDRSAPILPPMPGVPGRRTHDYVRDGTTNLYAALDTASGNVIAANGRRGTVRRSPGDSSTWSSARSPRASRSTSSPTTPRPTGGPRSGGG